MPRPSPVTNPTDHEKHLVMACCFGLSRSWDQAWHKAGIETRGHNAQSLPEPML